MNNLELVNQYKFPFYFNGVNFQTKMYVKHKNKIMNYKVSAYSEFQRILFHHEN